MTVLQRLEGLSDREAVDRFPFDVRRRYAAGVGGRDGAGAVATMDTITLIGSAIRGLLGSADSGLRADQRAVSTSGDDYAGTAEPVVDRDDATARETLIDSCAWDGYALLTSLDGRKDLSRPVVQAMRLRATVLGQDLHTGCERRCWTGMTRSARR